MAAPGIQPVNPMSSSHLWPAAPAVASFPGGKLPVERIPSKRVVDGKLSSAPLEGKPSGTSFSQLVPLYSADAAPVEFNMEKVDYYDIPEVKSQEHCGRRAGQYCADPYVYCRFHRGILENIGRQRGQSDVAREAALEPDADDDDLSESSSDEWAWSLFLDAPPPSRRKKKKRRGRKIKGQAVDGTPSPATAVGEPTSASSTSDGTTGKPVECADGATFRT